jgi:hypothetical protein
VTRSYASLAVVALLALLLPRPATASPWTLPRAGGAVGLKADFQFANHEWLLSGDYQAFPLQGRYFSANLRLGARYGITDRFEIGASLALSHVQYEADEVFLGAPVGPEFDDLTSNADVVDNVLSFDRRATGISDVELMVRYRITPPKMWRFTAAPEIHFKIPTGYRKPGGTFGDDGELADDVTLGDGQLDITFRMHAGVAPHPRLFLRGDVGFRLRLFGPGQQVVGGLKFGGRIGAFLIPYIGADIEHTVNQGKVIGTSIQTASPDKPARELRAEDLVMTEYRLDRTALRPAVGVIFSFPKYELEIGYATIAWGVNVAQLHVVQLGGAVKW